MVKDKNKLEIDIWVPNIKLAIEYDGEQHFRAVKFSPKQTDKDTKEAFSKLKRRDKIKNKLISQHPKDITYFVRFSYKDKITKEFVLEKLKEHNVPI